jgi:putative component of membrane protein insertase Oxa1/YidC/SpoIIIJ protein YidD
MKLAISSIALFTLAFSSTTFAQAETCSSRAQTCVMKWGSPRAACFDSFRLAACEKTGKYVAPNGNIWPASRAQRKTNVES